MIKIKKEEFVRIAQNKALGLLKKELDKIVQIKKENGFNFVVQINELEYNDLSFAEIKEKVFKKMYIQSFNDFLKLYQVEEFFLEENAYFLDWNIVSEFQELSMNFLKKFKNEVCWEKIIIYQNLTEKQLSELGVNINIKNKKEEVAFGSSLISFFNGTTTIAVNNNVTTLMLDNQYISSTLDSITATLTNQLTESIDARVNHLLSESGLSGNN